MAGIALHPPLGSPMQYDATFKVEVYLEEPLWPDVEHANVKVILESLALCSQIDLLCRKELAQQSNGRIDHGKVSNSFETKAMVMLDRLNSSITNLPYPHPTAQNYLDFSGLDSLYPRAAAYVTRPNDLSLANKPTHHDGYFQQLASLHQLLSLAHQINSDITNLDNHKYIAHQVALLYQCIKGLGDMRVFLTVKENIEKHFSDLKESLTSPADSDDESEEIQKKDVRLPHHYEQWLLEVTAEIVSTVTSFPSELCSNNVFLPAQLLL